MQESKAKSDRQIFKTLKTLINSESALSVEALENMTGFGRRMVQRHVATLSDIGMIRRVNKEQGIGYLYIRNIKFVSQFNIQNNDLQP